MTRFPSFTVAPALRDMQDRPEHDSPERRAEYIDGHRVELVEWLREGYPDILDEFIEHYWWDYKD